MLLASTAVPSASAAESWRELAQSALISALEQAYPQVATWNVEPLLGEVQRAGLDQSTPATAKAIVLGARSAVRIASGDSSAVRTVWFAVSGGQPVLTARVRIKAGSNMDAAVATESVRDVMSVGCSPLTSLQDVVGKRARRSFAPDAILCAEGFEPRPAVARGEVVRVRSIAGPVTVIASGAALQDGSPGQVLKVRNPTSKRTYLATVSGAQEVTVHD
jgi:flagella basal body P-ring formation protein FlgA